MIIKKPHPLFTILKKAGYKKHSVIVTVFDDEGTVILNKPMWDGGSRDSHFAINKKGETRHVTSGLELFVKDWYMIVTGGISRGKQAIWKIRITKSDWNEIENKV